MKMSKKFAEDMVLKCVASLEAKPMYPERIRCRLEEYLEVL